MDNSVCKIFAAKVKSFFKLAHIQKGSVNVKLKVFLLHISHCVVTHKLSSCKSLVAKRKMFKCKRIVYYVHIDASLAI